MIRPLALNGWVAKCIAAACLGLYVPMVLTGCALLAEIAGALR
jgi:hypothetical protein